MKTGVIYFDKYKIIGEIGSGGTSKVYLAENIKLGNKWAIKETNKNKSHINLLAEPYILRDLKHPSIPVIIDIEETKDYIYIVEEYIEGVTIGEYRNKYKTIPIKKVIDYGKQLCQVLNYLHNARDNPIIYRDLKPDNIIITNNNKLKLIDFGIAREYKEYNERDTVQIGTRGYAAPEQYGISQSDIRTDIFSLGVILYYLLTGNNLSKPPYKIIPITQINKDFPKKLEEIILKCTETLPEKRYDNVSYVLDELTKLDEKANNYKLNIIENVKEHTKHLITVGGVIKRIGATHTVVSIGNYLLCNNHKVALIEMNDSKDFAYIENMYLDIEATIDYFTLNKIDYYPNIKRRKEKVIKKHYDFIILDLGILNSQEKEDEFNQGEFKLLLTGGKDWEIPKLEDFILEETNEDYIYLFNYISEQQYTQLKKSMGNLISYRLPYNTNPFSTNSRQINTFKQIITTPDSLEKESLYSKLVTTKEKIIKSVIKWGEENEEKSSIIKKIQKYRKTKEGT